MLHEHCEARVSRQARRQGVSSVQHDSAEVAVRARRWLKNGNNLSGMRPWLYKLADEEDGYVQTLFCPDIRIQTVLAVEKATRIPPPKGDPGYPLLNDALQTAWGARVASSFLDDHPVPNLADAPLRRSRSGRHSISGGEAVPAPARAGSGAPRGASAGPPSARGQATHRPLLLRKTHSIVRSAALASLLRMHADVCASGECCISRACARASKCSVGAASSSALAHAQNIEASDEVPYLHSAQPTSPPRTNSGLSPPGPRPLSPPPSASSGLSPPETWQPLSGQGRQRRGAAPHGGSAGPMLSSGEQHSVGDLSLPLSGGLDADETAAASRVRASIESMKGINSELRGLGAKPLYTS